MSSPVNHIHTAAGLVKAVCLCCNRQSKPTKPDKDGEPQLFALPNGWSQAPFPAHFEHRDGSRGSTYTCPGCNRRLHKGERLRTRGGTGAAMRTPT